MRYNQRLLLRYSLLTALLPLPAFAQGDGDDNIHTLLPFHVTSDREVGYRATTTISASRLNIPLSEVPVNIPVMTADFIQDAGSNVQREALDWHAAINGKSIRGFDTGEFYRNGFQHLSDTQGFFIQRMEIVRGPTAILNGPIQPGGGINVITKQAILGNSSGEVSVQQTFGDAHDYRVVNLDINAGNIGPEADYGQTLAFRFVGGYQMDTGRAAGVGNDYGAILPSLRWRPTEATTITLEYYNYKLDSDRTDHHAGILKTIKQDSNNKAVQPLANFDGIEPWTSWLGPDASAPETLNEVLLNVNHVISDTLFLDVSFNRHDRDLKFNNMMHGNGLGGINAVLKPGASPDAQSIGDYMIERKFRDALIGNVTDQQSFLLTWTPEFNGERDHKIIFGYQNYEQERLLYFADAKKLDGSGVYTQLISPFATDLSVPLGDFFYDFKNPALDRREFNDQSTMYVNWLGEWLDGRLHTMVSLFDTDMSQVFTKKDGTGRDVRHKGGETLPQLGAVLDITDTFGVYAAYTKSSAINSNQAPPTTQLNLFFPPLAGEMKEIGFRFDLMESKLVGSVGIYEVDQVNRLEYDLLKDLFVNVGDIESKGVDLDLFYYPIENATIMFSYAMNDKKLPSGAEQFANPDKWTIWGKYAFTEGALDGVSVGGGYIHVDGTPTSNGTFTGTSPSRTRADVFISKTAALTDKVDYTISLNIRNLTGDATMSNNVVAPAMLANGFKPNSAERYMFHTDPEYQVSFGLKF